MGSENGGNLFEYMFRVEKFWIYRLWGQKSGTDAKNFCSDVSLAVSEHETQYLSIPRRRRPQRVVQNLQQIVVVLTPEDLQRNVPPSPRNSTASFKLRSSGVRMGSDCVKGPCTQALQTLGVGCNQPAQHQPSNLSHANEGACLFGSCKCRPSLLIIFVIILPR